MLRLPSRAAHRFAAAACPTHRINAFCSPSRCAVQTLGSRVDARVVNGSAAKRFHGGHGHAHAPMDSPYDSELDIEVERDFNTRPFTVGIAGPVGAGKTALLLQLCKKLRDRGSIAVVTNDIFTREDCDFLTRNQALPAERVAAVETGGCPHAAIREDISGNVSALEALTRDLQPRPVLLFCESGGDNLAATFSRELSDYTVYVIDVAGGDKVPRKGGPGVTQSDLLVINKIDLAEAVGADLSVMDRDAKKMRQGPFLFASIRNDKGVDEIIEYILKAMAQKVPEAAASITAK